ncbi:MAG: hypothetical protein AYK19_12240 [Theionarchaea archaeon DG-70-1]|nr:MAG: hypothetical protein AYK19_12240 [Theionarchaea archaeon DG-70-1]
MPGFFVLFFVACVCEYTDKEKKEKRKLKSICRLNDPEIPTDTLSSSFSSTDRLSLPANSQISIS